jgi:hypothetical protein
MATSKKFEYEPRMETTEPSVDEVKMKRGGHAKKMAFGGAPMMTAPMAAKRPMARRPAMAAAVPALMRKKGGSVANEKAELKRVDREERDKSAEIKRVEKELKHHEGMKASKAHKGLKSGGMYKPTPGGLLSDGYSKAHTKGTTGDIELSKYKKGGKLHKAEGGAAKGDSFQARSALKPKIDVQDKVVSAEKNKKAGSSTGGIEGPGYKRGGAMKKFAKGGTVSDSVASRYVSNMQDGEKNKKAGSKTGSLELSKFKKGGHVTSHGHEAHHKKTAQHHEHGGHVMHKEHMAKKHAHGGHVHHKEHMCHGGSSKVSTTKMSTHKKAGGKCNY